MQVNVRCVSDSRLPNRGSLLALLQHDRGKYSTEYLYSTDSALLGVRSLHNFGPDPPEHVYQSKQLLTQDSKGRAISLPLGDSLSSPPTFRHSGPSRPPPRCPPRASLQAAKFTSPRSKSPVASAPVSAFRPSCTTLAFLPPCP